MRLVPCGSPFKGWFPSLRFVGLSKSRTCANALVCLGRRCITFYKVARYGPSCGRARLETDWGLMLPVTLLTGGRLGVNSEFSKGVALARLCAGQDVGVGLITGDRGQRFNEIQTVLAWNAPQISTYVVSVR